MRVRALLGWIAVALLLGARPVDAGVLTSGTWTQTVSAPFGVGLTFQRTAGQLGLSSSSQTSTATSLSVDLEFFPPFTASLFFPQDAAFPINRHLALQQGGPQQITATPGMANGTPGIPGNVVVRTAAHDSMGVNQSMFMVGNFTLVNVPLNVGAAGQFTNTFTIVGALIHQTVDFFAWTPGTLKFTGLTTRGASLPDVVAMGSWGLTSHGGGTVTLVSPSRLTLDCVFPDGCTFDGRSVLTLATLKLTFIPEPGSLLLLAAAALSLTGRWRGASARTAPRRSVPPRR